MQSFAPLFLQAPGAGAGTINFLFIGLMLMIFYFFMIRPQAKKQREQKAFSDNLQKDDEVVTASGTLGTITKIEGDVITLEISNKTYMRVTRSAISKELTDALYGGKSA